MSNYSEIFALLRTLNIVEEDDRRELISNYTNGRTDSLRQLSNKELLGLKIDLRKRAREVGRDKADRMRKKVIWILCSMGSMEIKSTNEVFNFEVNNKPNMKDINAIVLRLGYKKKELKYYYPSELPQLVTQFEQIKKNTWSAEAQRAIKYLAQ